MHTCVHIKQLPVPLKYRGPEDEDEDEDAWLRAGQKVKAKAKGPHPQQRGRAAAAGTVVTSAKEVCCLVYACVFYVLCGNMPPPMMNPPRPFQS